LKFGAKISAKIKMLKAECVTSYRTFQGLYLEFCANVCQRSYARIHRQSLSELVKDGIEWRIEQSADPREQQVEYYDNTVLQELVKPVHLVDDRIPFDEDVAVTLEVSAQPTPDISSYDNTVLQERVPQRRGRQSTMRQPIIDLLHEHPEGLSATELKVYLHTDKRFGDTLQGMVRAGILKSGKRGKYILA
jgi:hypothetical protein